MERFINDSGEEKASKIAPDLVERLGRLAASTEMISVYISLRRGDDEDYHTPLRLLGEEERRAVVDNIHRKFHERKMPIVEAVTANGGEVIAEHVPTGLTGQVTSDLVSIIAEYEDVTHVDYWNPDAGAWAS